MNKSEYIKFSQFVGLDNDPCIIPDPAPVKDDSDFQRVLDAIFSVDPVSGLPISDISYYMSPNGDPVIRDWLMNNLLKPRASASGQTLDGDYDDVIKEFSRGVDESVDSYRERMFNIRKEAQSYIDSHKNDEK